MADPFGVGQPDRDVDGDGRDFELGLRFPGQYFDAETGKHYNYFRTYDPSTGRYITSDPVGLNAGPNTYGYVLANPINYTDVFGLKTECKWVTTRTYEKVIAEQVQPEKGYFRELCFPVPEPTIGIPDPGWRKLPSSPADMSYTMKCVEEWVVTQEAKYRQRVEKWVSGYMECTDTCTGEVTKHWSPDRRADDKPDIE